MARPNTLTFKSGGIIQMISNAEFNTVADVVLEKFALSDGPGSLFIDTLGGNNAYTVIGTFSDTYTANDVGGSDITVLSVNTDITQDRTTNYGTVSERPLTWDSSTNAVRKFTDTELSNFADDIVDYMVTQEGPGSYRLSNSAPTGYGGTWALRFTFTNFLDASTSSSPSGLYQKIDNSPTLNQRPLKVQQPGVLQLMSNTEIFSLSEKVRERIVATNIGSRRDTVAGSTYVGTIIYSGDYLGNYVGTRDNAAFAGPTYIGTGVYFRDVSYAGYILTRSYLGPEFSFSTYIGPRGPVDFSATYVGDYALDVDYSEPNVVGSPISQISELTLWRRVA